MSERSFLERSFKRPMRHRFVDRVCCGSSICTRIVDIITLNGYPGFRVREQPGHSAPMQCLGALLLYVAWFSFNSGSSGGLASEDIRQSAGRAAVNTMLAAASGTTVALIWCEVFRKHYEINLVVNGLLSSLVAITAGCGYVDPWAAIVVGALALPTYVASSKVVLYGLHVDDSLDAVSVHGSCGILGTLWVGFASLDGGLLTGGGATLLGVQALGCLSILAWASLNSFLYFNIVKCILSLSCLHPARNGSEADENEDETSNPIVYSQDAQLVGLDFFYYGGSGFPDFDVEAVSEFNATQRIKQRFHARKNQTSRMFDRDALEISTHGTRYVSTNPSSVLGTTTE